MCACGFALSTFLFAFTSNSFLLITFSPQRAHTLSTRISADPSALSQGHSLGDSLPAAVHPAEFLSLLCAACEPPVFAVLAKEKVEKVERARERKESFDILAGDLI